MVDCPSGGLVQATNGKLYGTTYDGGTNDKGTVFSITTNGTLTTLHSFNDADGAGPSAGLAQGTDAKFYGTTSDGGANDEGTVFSITAGGALTSLDSFDYTDGDLPYYAGVVQGPNGQFYGTTLYGGADGEGTVFSVTTSGTLTTVHSFDITDGAQPDAGLVQGADGSFHGTTQLGGAHSAGTVFSITAGGILTTLYSFCATGGNCTDGLLPRAGLIQATDGMFYGTTAEGGAFFDGTVFSITAGGRLTTLHSFDKTDGYYPQAAVVQGTDGNFYGTTRYGGTNNKGTIFKITPSGPLTTLHNFCSEPNCTDGSFPYAGLVQDTNGTFYGATSPGGANNGGTVFSLSEGLGPFVKTLPTTGKVRAAVFILGADLTGATSVTFNGTAAAFTVKSKSEITTAVPTGATTGTVQVVTPTSGTLLSNVPFTVE